MKQCYARSNHQEKHVLQRFVLQNIIKYCNGVLFSILFSKVVCQGKTEISGPKIRADVQGKKIKILLDKKKQLPKTI